jgi:hypothetical protein
MMYADYVVVYVQGAFIDTRIDLFCHCSCRGLTISIAQTHLGMYFGRQWFTLSLRNVYNAHGLCSISLNGRDKLVQARAPSIVELAKDQRHGL